MLFDVGDKNWIMTANVLNLRYGFDT